MCLFMLKKLSQTKYSLNVETGSLIFAIFNCLTLSGICLISVILLIGIICHAFPDVEEVLEVYGVFGNALADYLFLLVFLYTNFAFSIILIRGLLTRNSTQVKIYFIFGVVLSLHSLVVLAYSAFLTFAYYYESLADATKVSVLIVICIYVLILIMIRDTYKKFAKEEESDSPEKKMFIVNRLFQNLVSKDILTRGELVRKSEKV